jgi:hypothetical protein
MFVPLNSIVRQTLTAETYNFSMGQAIGHFMTREDTSDLKITADPGDTTAKLDSLSCKAEREIRPRARLKLPVT